MPCIRHSCRWKDVNDDGNVGFEACGQGSSGWLEIASETALEEAGREHWIGLPVRVSFSERSKQREGPIRSVFGELDFLFPVALPALAGIFLALRVAGDGERKSRRPVY